MMDVEQVVLGQIEGLEQQLAEARAMLQAVRESKRDSGDPKMRFFDRRPIDAAREVLRERGRMSRVDLEAAMIDGGLLVGKSREETNIEMSFRTNIKIGNLVEEGEYIDMKRKPSL